MAQLTPRHSLSGLPLRLVKEGLISQTTAKQLLATAQREGLRFASVAIRDAHVSSRDLAYFAGDEFGFPVFDLDVFDLSTLPKEEINDELVHKHHALPLAKRGSRLYLALSDPTNVAALDEFKFHSGLTTEPILVEEDKLAAIIRRAASQAGTIADNLTDTTTLDDTAEEEANEGEDASVVPFVNKIMLTGINRGASDIHIEPYEKSFRIRYRIDGILDELARPPLEMSERIISRIKVMSRMNVSERRVPQDGRIKLALTKDRAIDFRVNTCPTLFGEKIVLRILDSDNTQLGIDALGYESEQKTLYLKALRNPYGMILVTGPTGSGKTVSLYSGLNMLNDAHVNISTVEDPAEINLPGINQVNVNTAIGLTFAEALRAFLRQDPDVIMVGEIRDLETANIAIKAAQTGHLVLSTVHTNSAPETLTRLVNMGVAPFNIAASVSLIIAQRLARKLCEHCKVIDKIPLEAIIQQGFSASEAERLTLYKATGCSKCSNGYKGRTGIYQVMPISEAIGQLIMTGGNSLDIAEQAAKEGFADLRQSALQKVKAGVLCLEEANRVTKD